MLCSIQDAKRVKLLKPHYHIRLDAEFKFDCQVWLSFLMHPDLARVVNRPMIDLSTSKLDVDIGFYSDASHSEILGFGSILGDRWICSQWPPSFIRQCEPSIGYLELYALVLGIITWQDDCRLRDSRVQVHCDNMSVVHMINNITSSCKNCMFLLRKLILNGLLFNRRLTAKFVPTKENGVSDALSRLQFARFRKLALGM